MDEIKKYLQDGDLRSIAIEKITKAHPSYIDSHKTDIIELLNKARDKELMWHVALMVSRLDLSGDELEQVWYTLEGWVINRSESKIVTVNSLQALHELSNLNIPLKKEFEIIIRNIK